MALPHMEPHRRSTRAILISTLLLILGMIACVAAAVLSLDEACRQSIDEWTPLYPGSEIVRREYDLLRDRGMGTSFVVLYTEDDPATVGAWYREYQVEKGTRDNTLANADYRVTENPDGDGALIYLYSECAGY